MDLNARMPRVDASRFSMVPRADIPRSTFITTHSHKTTFDSAYLIPILVDEVLPGDVHAGQVQIFARLMTQLFPVMDHMKLETFFFFVPNRLVWDNWVKMMGERKNPADSISYTVPQHTSGTGGWAPRTLQDYMGCGVTGQVDPAQWISVNALPFRGYYLIWNEWFRDQNLQNELVFLKDDVSQGATYFVLQKRNKKHDYFTSALPWPLKGGFDVTMPMAGNAPVMGIGTLNTIVPTAGNPANVRETGGISSVVGWQSYYKGETANHLFVRGAVGGGLPTTPYIYADLSQATGQTINALRLAFQTQKLLERDARGGTRYTELLRSHFGVNPEDTRLQRPEYIGGGRSSINTQAIPQTSASGLTGGTAPLGALGATATASDRHSYRYTSTEHGFIIGLAHVTAEITYQQGLRRMWTRTTRYDYYWPAFAHLGEQAIRNDEIYVTGDDAIDAGTFGYQERWAEYRHRQSMVTGMFRSTTTSNIDEWHLAEQFLTRPLLNSTFITDNPPFSRVSAVQALPAAQQVLFDSVFKIKTTRAMPMFSVPGQIDRF